MLGRLNISQVIGEDLVHDIMNVYNIVEPQMITLVNDNLYLFDSEWINLGKLSHVKNNFGKIKSHNLFLGKV